MSKGEKDKDDLQKLQSLICVFSIQEFWKSERFKNFFFFNPKMIQNIFMLNDLTGILKFNPLCNMEVQF